MKKSNIRKNIFSHKILSFLIVLLPTLQSFYFYNISLAPFPLISMFLLFFFFILGGRFFINKSLLLFFILIVLFFLFFTFYSIFINKGDVYVRSIFGLYVSIFFFFLFSLYFSERKNELEGALKWVLILHVSAFFIQYAVWLFFNYYIDFLKPLTGEDQRYSGFSGLIRPTGLCNEPGTYSIYVATLLFLYTRFDKKHRILELLSITSIFLSLSLTGIFLMIFYLGILMYKKVKSNFFYSFLSVVFLLCCFAVFWYFLSDYFIVRMSYIKTGTDGSINTRLYSLLYFFNYDLLERLLGGGIGYLQQGVGFTSSNYVYLLNTFGILGSFAILLYVFIFFKSRKTNQYSIFYFFIFISVGSGVAFTAILFWMCFAIVSLSHKKNI